MLNKNKHKGIFSPSDEYMHFSGLVIGITGTHTKEDIRPLLTQAHSDLQDMSQFLY